MSDYTDDQIHRILLEQKFVFTIKEVCEKWGITPYRFRKWREAGTVKPYWTVEDCIIAGIHHSEWVEPAELIGWLDYRNHALYTEAEVRAMFESLESQGCVKRDGDRWKYVQVEPPYIFGPRP